MHFLMFNGLADPRLRCLIAAGVAQAYLGQVRSSFFVVVFYNLLEREFGFVGGGGGGFCVVW